MTTKTHVRKNYKSRKHTRKTVKLQKGGVNALDWLKPQQQIAQFKAHQTYLNVILPIQSELTGDAKDIFKNMTQQNINTIQLKSNVLVDHIFALKNLHEADTTINAQAKTGITKWFSKNSTTVTSARADRKTALDKLFAFIDKKSVI